MQTPLSTLSNKQRPMLTCPNILNRITQRAPPLPYRHPRNSLYLPQDPHNIQPHHHLHVFLTHSPPQHFSHQFRIPQHVLQAVRPLQHAVKVGADTDVREPDEIADVDDMIGCLVQSGNFCGGFGFWSMLEETSSIEGVKQIIINPSLAQRRERTESEKTLRGVELRAELR